MTGLFNIHTVFWSLSPKQSERREQFVSSRWSPPLPLSQRSQVVSSSLTTDGGVTSVTSVSNGGVV